MEKANGRRKAYSDISSDVVWNKRRIERYKHHTTLFRRLSVLKHIHDSMRYRRRNLFNHYAIRNGYLCHDNRFATLKTDRTRVGRRAQHTVRCNYNTGAFPSDSESRSLKPETKRFLAAATDGLLSNDVADHGTHIDEESVTSAARPL